MVERRRPKASKDDPICPVCLQPIKASDKVRGRSDELIHESCDYTGRPVPPRGPGSGRSDSPA